MPPMVVTGRRGCGRWSPNGEVHGPYIYVAAADQDRSRVRRDLRKAGGQDQTHVVISRTADAAIVVEAVAALAVGRGRGQHVAARVLQLHGDAGQSLWHGTAMAALADSGRHGPADRCLEEEGVALQVGDAGVAFDD